MLSGAISNLDNRDAIEYWLIKARYKSDLFFDLGQVRIYRLLVKSAMIGQVFSESPSSQIEGLKSTNKPLMGQPGKRPSGVV
uniref:Uncharacterized protein n=1 Tax=Helianthus annuus TaxID=4232 RepID=A0A251SV63_HELAN